MLNRVSLYQGFSQRHLRLGLVALVFFPASVAMADNEWANWRGPEENGSSLDATPPVHWGAESNIEWKAELDGLGSSTPIVWGNQVFVLSALKTDRTDPSMAAPTAPVPPPRPEPRIDPLIPPGVDPGPLRNGPDAERGRNGGRRSPPNRGGGGMRPSERPIHAYQFLVTSYDLETGAKNWQSIAVEEIPHEGAHGTNNYASSSPVTDGEHLYAFFGSRGIFCFDLQGNAKWNADLGQQHTRNEFGEGSSAALHKDTLVIQWDHEGESFIAALDKSSGDLKWKTDRDEKTTWSTPLIVEHNGTTQVITNGERVRSYDINDGTLIWECGGQTDNPIPTPLVYRDTVIVTTGFRGAACYAFSLDAKGELKEDSKFIKWTYNQNTPYVPSPALYKDTLYFVSENKAILSAINAETGQPVFARTRLNGLDVIYSSVGAADNKIFFTERNGTTLVLSALDGKDVLAVNKLDEEIDASHVFVKDRLLLRSNKHLFSIKE